MGNDTTSPGVGTAQRGTLPGDLTGDSGFGSLLEALAAAPVRAVDRARTLCPGSVVGDRYQVERELGQGGMGVVYQALDRTLARPIAIKVCFDSTTDSGVARITREARALAALSHPNVLEVYGVGRHGGMVYIAMEYVEGGTAAQWARRRTRGWAEIVEFYCRAAEGLAAAHQHGIVHRDFKPDNVLVGRDGRPRVADFGLASPFESAGPLPPSAEVTLGEESEERLTRTGAVVGTPAYMAPEQMFGLDVDGRADQFALCCALFETLFGTRPFGGKSGRARLAEITRGRPRWPRSSRGIPRRVISAIDRGLKTDPDARWPSMEALVRELRAPSGRGWWIAGGSVLVGGVFAVVGSFGHAQVRCAPNPTWADTWDAATERGVEASLLAAGVEDDARSVVGALDRYADELVEQYAVVCGLDDAAFDPAMACLRRRRDAFSRTTERLAGAGPEVGARAHALVAALEPVTGCGDAHARDGRGEGERHRRVRADIDVAHLEQIAGDLAAADVASARALDAARGLEAPALLSEALSRRAFVVEELSRSFEAVELWEEAYFVASSAGRSDVAALCLLGLVRIHGGVGPQGLERALRWHAMAVAAAQNSPDVLDPLAVDVELGTALTLGDRADEAREVLEAVVAALDTREEGPTELRLRALMALGGTYQVADVSDRLAPTREAALALSIELWGPAHPKTGVALEGLSVARSRSGDLDQVEPLLRRAARIYEVSFGERKDRQLSVYNKLGAHFHRSGETDRAIEVLQEALALGERIEGRPPAAMVNLESNLGSALLEAGEDFDAIIHLERAVALAEAIHGPDTLRTSEAVINAGAVYLALHRYRDAVNSMRQAVGILDGLGSSGRRARLVARLNLAIALSKLGELEAAFAALDRAQSDDPFEERAAELASLRGALHLDNESYAESVTEFERCSRLFAKLTDTSHPASVRCRADLAHVELLRGNLDRAAGVLAELIPVVLAPASGARQSTIVNVHLNYARAIWNLDRRRAVKALRLVLERTGREPHSPLEAQRADALALAQGLPPKQRRRLLAAAQASSGGPAD